MTAQKSLAFGVKLAVLWLVLSPAVAWPAVRECAVCGQFYPADAKTLAADVDGYINRAGEAVVREKTIAIIAPHAGYVYSGAIAGFACRNIAKKYDTVVILATGHKTGVRGAALMKGIFRTPLGDVPVDDALVDSLAKDKTLFEINPSAHEGEHAVEVQLPFLQRRLQPPFKIVPAVMNMADYETAAKIGKALAAALKGKTALIIMSSDMSHYPKKQDAELADKTALLSLEAMDPYYFWVANRVLLGRGVNNLDCVCCGETAVIAGAAAAKELGANKAQLIKYTNSGDIPSGDVERVVGYAAMAFVKSAHPAKFGFNLEAGDKKYLLDLARKSIKAKLENAPFAYGLSQKTILNLPAAVFVTLNKNGKLRGCIGTTEARGTLADSVAYFALAAAFNDSRFEPVASHELGDIRIEISILSRSEPVKSADDIIPNKHGVTVERDGHAGLFLPQVWEQLPNKREFLSELCSQKAGLEPDCWKNPAVRLNVFTVLSFKEP